MVRDYAHKKYVYCDTKPNLPKSSSIPNINDNYKEYKKCYILPDYVHKKYVYCDVKPNLPIPSISPRKNCYIDPHYYKQGYAFCDVLKTSEPYENCYMKPGYINGGYTPCLGKPNLPKLMSNNNIIDDKKCYLTPGYVSRNYVYCDAKPSLPILAPDLNNDYKESCYDYIDYVDRGYSVCEMKPDLPKSLTLNNSENCYAEPKYYTNGYAFCNMSKDNAGYNSCYMKPSYVNRGYAECLLKPNLPLKPKEVELFVKKYKVSYKGAPGVIINEKIKQKTQIKYKFVTSIIIESEQGDINSPVIVNSSKELLNIFGQKITNDMLYALSFLNYSPSLLVSRSTGLNSFNSSSTNFPKAGTSQFKPIRINNYDDFESISTDEFLGKSYKSSIVYNRRIK